MAIIKSEAVALSSPVQKRVGIDEQSGKEFELRQESTGDYAAAIVSVVYMLLIMVFFFYLLFALWFGRLGLPQESPSQLPVFAMIGGALGGIVNGIRSFLVWHAELSAFGRRFVWKYIAAPWQGAALALFTFALIRGGVAVFSGQGAQTAGEIQILSTFGIGVLAGYGAHKVFIWLDAQVTSIFQVQPTTVIVPPLTGKTREEAEEILKAARLTLGEVQEVDPDDASQAGKVVRQTPPPGSAVASGVSVSITVGRRDAKAEGPLVLANKVE